MAGDRQRLFLRSAPPLAALLNTLVFVSKNSQRQNAPSGGPRLILRACLGASTNPILAPAARRGCEAVLSAFLKEGGHYRQAQATPGPILANRMKELSITPGEVLIANHYVFALGPWLGKSSSLGSNYYSDSPGVFSSAPRQATCGSRKNGCPPGLMAVKTPSSAFPGNHWRGFKIASDTRGPVIDPITMEREISEEKLAASRDYLRLRFPALADAPLVESRVCQYEILTDHNFILDRHPAAENVWIVGGGSGHGFKHG